MLANLGYLALVLALGCALYAVIMALLSASRNNPVWLASARRAAFLTWPLITLAAVLLIVLLVTDQYQISYVANSTSRAMPLYLKITALWGGQEGSLVFWAWLMATFTGSVMLRRWERDRTLMPAVIAVTNITLGFFIALVVFIENPFARLWHTPEGQILQAMWPPAGTLALTPADGRGLNPLLRHPGMIPRVRRRLHANAVVAHRNAFGQGVIHQRKMPPGFRVAGHIVTDAKPGPGKEPHMEINMLPHNALGALFRHAAAAHRMALPPHPVTADVQKRHRGIAIVPRGHRFKEVFQLLQKYRIAKIRVPQRAVLLRAFAELKKHALGARVFHPFRRGEFEPAFGARNAEGNLFPPGNPALGRCVQQGPVELAFSRLDVGPGHAQIHGAQAREIIQSIRRLELRAVVLRDVGIEMHRPAHVRVHQRLAGVRGTHRVESR